MPGIGRRFPFKIPTSCEYSEYNFYNKHHVFKDLILFILDILCHISFSALLPNMLELFVYMCRTLCLKLLVFRTSTSTWNWWGTRNRKEMDGHGTLAGG